MFYNPDTNPLRTLSVKTCAEIFTMSLYDYETIIGLRIAEDCYRAYSW